jgi:hypothetical protein
VLDTDFIRTGLHYQLRNGIPPRSVRTAQQGSLRVFMEYDTLTETEARLPKFAGQLGVPVADLAVVADPDEDQAAAAVRHSNEILDQLQPLRQLLGIEVFFEVNRPSFALCCCHSFGDSVRSARHGCIMPALAHVERHAHADARRDSRSHMGIRVMRRTG